MTGHAPNCRRSHEHGMHEKAHIRAARLSQTLIRFGFGTFVWSAAMGFMRCTSGAQPAWFADGYHGGIYGHYPPSFTQFIVGALRHHPDWRLNLEIEPETWDFARTNTPEAYQALKALITDPAVPRHQVEALKAGSTWETMAALNLPAYIQAAREASIAHPVGMCLQDAGWRFGPWLGHAPGSYSPSEYVTRTHYFETVAVPRLAPDWRVSQEDFPAGPGLGRAGAATDCPASSQRRKPPRAGREAGDPRLGVRSNTLAGSRGRLNHLSTLRRRSG